jgi:hypothetical protein
MPTNQIRLMKKELTKLSKERELISGIISNKSFKKIAPNVTCALKEVQRRENKKPACKKLRSKKSSKKRRRKRTARKGGKKSRSKKNRSSQKKSCTENLKTVVTSMLHKSIKGGSSPSKRRSRAQPNSAFKLAKSRLNKKLPGVKHRGMIPDPLTTLTGGQKVIYTILCAHREAPEESNAGISAMNVLVGSAALACAASTGAHSSTSACAAYGCAVNVAYFAGLVVFIQGCLSFIDIEHFKTFWSDRVRILNLNKEQKKRIYEQQNSEYKAIREGAAVDLESARRRYERRTEGFDMDSSGSGNNNPAGIREAKRGMAAATDVLERMPPSLSGPSSGRNS